MTRCAFQSSIISPLARCIGVYLFLSLVMLLVKTWKKVWKSTQPIYIARTHHSNQRNMMRSADLCLSLTLVFCVLHKYKESCHWYYGTMYQCTYSALFMMNCDISFNKFCWRILFHFSAVPNFTLFSHLCMCDFVCLCFLGSNFRLRALYFPKDLFATNWIAYFFSAGIKWKTRLWQLSHFTWNTLYFWRGFHSIVFGLKNVGVILQQLIQNWAWWLLFNREFQIRRTLKKTMGKNKLIFKTHPLNAYGPNDGSYG